MQKSPAIISFLAAVLFLWAGDFLFADSDEENMTELGKPRIWTSVNGHRLKATYQGRDGDKIRLLAKGGKIKIILLEKLSEDDQRLLEDTEQEENGGRKESLAGSGESRGQHPFVRLLAEAPQKRLSPEEGVKYYQSVLDALFKQVREYHFSWPEDFIKDDNSFNMKYLNRIEQKRQPIAKRKNLLTGEPLSTPIYANEPVWREVSQKLSYELSEEEVSIIQDDTLYAGNKEKLVRFRISIPRTANANATFWSWYREDARNYVYSLPTLAELGDDGKIHMTGRPDPRENGGWFRLGFYDERQRIFYLLCVYMDREGKITIRNSEGGSFQFFASEPASNAGYAAYPRDRYLDRGSYWVGNSRFAMRFGLGRYDLHGKMIPMENVWEKARKDSETEAKAVGIRPAPKHKDPLNIFAERNN